MIPEAIDRLTPRTAVAIGVVLGVLAIYLAFYLVGAIVHLAGPADWWREDRGDRP